jgi:hypothetical protein
MLERLGEQTGKTVEVKDGLEIKVAAVDAERIQGTKGPATISLRWRDLSVEHLHDLMVDLAERTAAGRLDLAVFARELGLTEDAEGHLLMAHRADATVKPRVDALLARWRDEDVPEGGYVVHEDAWVRPEDRDLLVQGYRRLDGRWVSEEEYMLAKGLVRYEGRWISVEERDRREEAERELEDLAKKYLPKGLIDQRGNDGEAVDWSDAIVVKTENYKIRTNLGEQMARDVGFTMETLHWNFRRILGLGRKRMPKFEIQVCRDHSEYREVLKGMGLGQASSGGVIKTFYQPPRTTAVLMHEGTHQFLYKLSPTCPRWVHEGMATYFECSQFRFDERRRRTVLDVGLLNRHRLMGIQGAIRNDSYANMELFLEGKKGNPYTQGWSVIYYLAKAHDGKYAKRLLPFVEDAGKGSTIKRFRKTFGIRDLVKFEQDWRRFVMGLDPAKGVDVFVDEGMGRRGGGGR